MKIGTFRPETNELMSNTFPKKGLLLLAIILISLNLRPAITAVGPLIGEIRSTTGLSNSAIGLLTTLPVLAFGLFSILTPLFTRRIGTEGTMTLALSLLTGGILIRVIPSIPMLFLGTLILGTGIALGNVLLPGIVKKQFPQKAGLLTGIYSSMLGMGAAIASGVSVPISEGLNVGWRWTLASFAAFSLLALFSWLPQMKQNMPVVMKKSFRQSLSHLSGSALAWHVAIFVGLQSLSFYTVITWLPEILIERGMNSQQAGWMLAMMQGVGVIGTFLLPSWASRRENQKQTVIIIVLFEVISITGLLIPSAPLPAFWVSLLGFCLGGSFGLALLFIVVRSPDSDTANELSGMSQSVGYLLAATGPVLFGALFDWTGDWTIPIGFLLLIALVKLWSGLEAGKNRVIS